MVVAGAVDQFSFILWRISFRTEVSSLALFLLRYKMRQSKKPNFKWDTSLQLAQ